MSSSSTPVVERFSAARGVLDGLGTSIDELRDLSDEQLLRLNQDHAHLLRVLGAAGASIAGELAYRSRAELGSEGLARRTGHRTVENLLKTTTGATKEQVLTVVAAGTLLVETADHGTVDAATGVLREATQPWLRPVAEAVGAGIISVSASQSITRGLGRPNSAVTAEQLETAAVELVAAAVAGVDADKLFRQARDLRTGIDLAGVKLQEEEQRQLRGLTHYALPTGGGVATWRMDPETYAEFVDFFDRTTSPKRGGVRFVDPARALKARKIADDERTFTQLASDALLHFLKVGADADDSVMVGSGAPVIRVTIAEKALTTGIGFGRIDGQPGVVSVDTVKRLCCEGSALKLAFDAHGHSLESEAEQRLFSRRQREILAAKFGGCMDPDCDRPPSWCEAHHIAFVKRDGGKTVTSNGILLCKYHHLKYHNDGYEIIRDQHGGYWKIPPTSVDTDQTPIPMPLKTRNLEDLWAAEARTAS